MQSRPIFTTGFLVLGVLAGCVTAPDPTPETIVIGRLNEEPITLQEALDLFVEKHGGGHRVLVRGDKAVRDLVDRVVQRRLLLQEAAELGIPEEPTLVAGADQLRWRMAEEIFWREEVDQAVHVTAAEVEEFYERGAVLVSVSIIQTADRETAEGLRSRVLAGERFEELAEAGSTHSSAEFGGLLGWTPKGTLDPALDEAAYAMTEAGTLCPVVEVEDGFAFVRLDEREDNPDRAGPDVAFPQIRMVLEAKAKDEARTALEEEVAREGELTVHEELITRDAILEGEGSDTLVVSSGGEELTLGALHAMLDPEALKRVSEEEADAGARAIAHDWGQRRAVRQAVEARGYLEKPQVLDEVRKYRERTTLNLLLGNYVYRDIELGDEDVRAWYEEHKEEAFTRPEAVRIAYLVVETDDAAQAALSRLAEGEEFAVVAQEISIDPDPAKAAMGAWVEPGAILPEIEERAFALETGAVDGPIATDRGVFVVKALERREETALPFEQVAVAAQRKAFEAARRERLDDWVSKLRERAQVEMDESGIQQAVAWANADFAQRQEELQRMTPKAPPSSPHGTTQEASEPTTAEEG